MAKTTSCYIGLGSNMGSRAENLKIAIHQIELKIGPIKKVSQIYESEPWGYNDSTNYFNQVVLIETGLTPVKLLKACLTIEDELGRIRTKDSYEPRTIDIDILFYGIDSIQLHNLTIPHEHICERKFVLLPLKEIAKDFVHPLKEKTIEYLYDNCDDRAWVKVLK